MQSSLSDASDLRPHAGRSGAAFLIPKAQVQAFCLSDGARTDSGDLAVGGQTCTGSCTAGLKGSGPSPAGAILGSYAEAQWGIAISRLGAGHQAGTCRMGIGTR